MTVNTTPTSTPPPLDSAASPATSPAQPLPGAPESLSITDFLTDGSLAGVCTELSKLTGVPVQLVDQHGRVIVQRRGEGGSLSWTLSEEPPIAESGAGTRIPLKLPGIDAIGFIVMGPGEPALDAEARVRLEAALTLLARTATELCRNELELVHRIKEVQALSRMSSLLVRAAGPDKVLEVALELALDVLGLDAGSIVLLKEKAEGITGELEEDLTLQVSRHLSREWLESPLPLSRSRVFDALALTGQVVISEDLQNDERVLIKEQAAREGLGAALHAGLVFKGRPLGVIRLYSREPRAFGEEDKRLLASLAQQAAAALEQSRLLRFEQEEQRVQRQLQLAADVQRRMLPRSVPSLAGLDVAARYIPSFELGGDFYDFIELNGHLGVVVGDVVGKGIAAALLMSAVRASLRAHVQEVYDLDEVVARVNQAMCRDTRDNEFASLWYGVIDPVKLRLTYCSAGHEPPIIVRATKGRLPTHADLEELIVGGMVVGVDPTQRYQRAVFDLRPGDTIVAYTDGLVDQTSVQGQRFGKKRLREAVLGAFAAHPDPSAHLIAEHLLEQVRAFAGSSPRPDDKSIAVVRVLSRGQASPVPPSRPRT